MDCLAAKVAYWGDRCWMCHEPWNSLDHVKPLAAGGPHCLANLRPACMRCNRRKNASPRLNGRGLIEAGSGCASPTRSRRQATVGRDLADRSRRAVRHRATVCYVAGDHAPPDVERERRHAPSGGIRRDDPGHQERDPRGGDRPAPERCPVAPVGARPAAQGPCPPSQAQVHQPHEVEEADGRDHR